MPELPEVETIVSDLRPILKGQCFVALKSSHKNHVAGAVMNMRRIGGKKVREVLRRGKFINIFFENDYVMTIHLKMSGRLIWLDNDGPASAFLKYERTRIDFEKGSLRFCDVRKFGRVWICPVDEYERVTGIARLGFEPFTSDFSFEKFSRSFGSKRGNVKKWLLDQRIIAGVGNIYADEGCFYAGIRPDSKIEKLEDSRLKKLFEGVLKALRQGIRNRGTSISDFADAHGKAGRNQEVLYVYGRGGEPCLQCGTKLVKIKVAQRGTVFCENCQKLI